VLSLTLAICSTQASPADSPVVDLYKQLKAFKLSNASVKVQEFTLERDNLHMVFNGEFYFGERTGAGVYGAVFTGQGRFRSEAKSPIEGESIKRFMNSTTVESTFTKAILRFTDDTYQLLSTQPAGGAAPAEAQRIASDFDEQLMRETGLNLTSRLVSAIANGDTPGFFFAEFDGGSRGRFSAVMDHQARVPSDLFNINGGEKGLIFKHEGLRFGTDVWTAFYDQRDFERNFVSYSDAFDLVSIPLYRLEVDLRDPGNWLRMQATIQMVAKGDNVVVIPMQLNAGLSEVDNVRKNKGVRILSAELSDGRPVGVLQEEWESGVSLVLPASLGKGQSVTVNLKMEGHDSLWSWGANFHYPRSTTSWYPRHGYLARSKFQLVFHHKKANRIASIGQRVKEEPAAGDDFITEWAVNDPVALVTFVCGPFQRHAENAQISGKEIPIEYYSPPGSVQAVKEDFILAEIGNAARFFDNMFGEYPYGRLGAAYFPTSYGQGFPTLLLLPARGTAVATEFSFLAHENSHQWWGNIVGWKSYRDQWLSEGFAEYSGVLYTLLRSGVKDETDMIRQMRRDLVQTPPTSTGAAKMKVHETGPLILGTRLNSTKSGGVYSVLVYSKGALVLRMLHFLLSDPERGTDTGFTTMMKDFVNRHRNGVATSESFMAVASEHFSRSPIGQRYKLPDLTWFLAQWVYQTGLPDFELTYKVEPRESGGFILKGTMVQEHVPEAWLNILPLVVEFSGGRIARTTVHAFGPKTEIEIRLPEKPQKVRLDPDMWILSDKTSEKG
jgi:hypothetical protein